MGERYNADAGLSYLNARYYDPKLAMFIQPDWFEVAKAGVGTNRYSYSFYDPVNKLDPRGNEIGGAMFGPSFPDSLVAVGAACGAEGALASGLLGGFEFAAVAGPKFLMETFQRDFGQEGITTAVGSDGHLIATYPTDFPAWEAEGMTAHPDTGATIFADPYIQDCAAVFEGNVLASTPGSYEIWVEKDGKTRVYVGKGDEARMQASGRRHAQEGYKVLERQWEKAKDHRSV